MHVGPDEHLERRKHLAIVRMAAGLVLAVDRGAVDDDVEDATAAGDEGEISDDVLVVRQQIRDRAHGAG